MRTSLLLAVLGPAIAASALPSAQPSTSDACDATADGRAATLFKQQHLVCGNVATDYTPIPAETSCFDLSSLYGVWEGKTRSLVVRKGFKCDFYREFKCPSTSSSLCLGSKTEDVKMETLPAEFDSKIYSVQCSKF